MYSGIALSLYAEPEPVPIKVIEPRCINSACTCTPAKSKFKRHAGICKG